METQSWLSHHYKFISGFGGEYYYTLCLVR